MSLNGKLKNKNKKSGRTLSRNKKMENSRTVMRFWTKSRRKCLASDFYESEIPDKIMKISKTRFAASGHIFLQLHKI